ncbi:MAG: DUF2169 domain-containing protein [Deltaproteobacteria bacterium]|nr:DUF2169 domain-containing protein [Deltaproteobacteria bacterium]
MEIYNQTPFSPLIFNTDAIGDLSFYTAVVRGTFTITSHKKIQLAQTQEPLALNDRFLNDPHTSSLIEETDLVPYKPRADIYLNAEAHAPNGNPLTNWLVRARIGQLTKTLRVCGQRYWRRNILGWYLDKPAPCIKVPLHYELAYGGTVTFGETSEAYEYNPVGLGYVTCSSSGRLKTGTLKSLPAPQIEAPNEPIVNLKRRYTPQGFGPINRAWLPRRTLAGSFDQAWLDRRSPRLPVDFNFLHYNSAHPDLIYNGFMQGDEPVILEGFDPHKIINFSLPGYKIKVAVSDVFGPIEEQCCQLDTVRIDVPARRVHLTWRAMINTRTQLDKMVVWTFKELKHAS